MTIICVDDERLLMEDTVAMCRELPDVERVEGFVGARDALRWLETNRADIALLDIDMPDINGIELALRIKQTYPDIAVIFLTGYAQFAVDAFAVRASGYLLKPVTREALAKDIEYALSLRSVPDKKEESEIVVRTFGSFDVLLRGRPIKFKIAKCKEILAYLVDRQGACVTRPEISSALWEDRTYDRKQQKQLDVYIRALRESLKEYGIERIFEMERGTLRVVPEQFSCDMYRFFAGDPQAVNAYRGEYMSAYSWASITEGALFGKQN